MAYSPGMFEKTFCINLDRRPERWEEFCLELPKPFPFNMPERYRAIDGQLCQPPEWWQSGLGAWGCYRTHLAILEKCLNENIKSVLIFEDDCIFPEDINFRLQDFLDELPKRWRMLYFGGEHLEKPKKFNKWVYEATNINRTHAYAIRGNFIQKVYNHLCRVDWKPKHHIDHHLGRFQKEQSKRIFCPKTWLAGQRNGASDVWVDGTFPTRFFKDAEALVS